MSSFFSCGFAMLFLMIFHILRGYAVFTRVGQASKDFVYIKLPKCASSTSAGIARRVAARRGACQWSVTGKTMLLLQNNKTAYSFENPARCGLVFSNHIRAASLLKGLIPTHINMEAAFKFTVLRHPVEREISEYNHFKVSRFGESPEQFKCEKGNFELKYITPKLLNWENGRPQDKNALHDALNFYNLVGTVENYNDFLLVLVAQLGLELGDVLFVPSKVSGAGGSVHIREHPYLYTYDEQLLGDCMDINREDLAMHAMATSKLAEMMKIYYPEDMNRERQRRRLEYALTLADNHCSNHADIAKCYWADNGCAYQCLNLLWEKLAPLHEKKWKAALSGFNGRMG